MLNGVDVVLNASHRQVIIYTYTRKLPADARRRAGCADRQDMDFHKTTLPLIAHEAVNHRWNSLHARYVAMTSSSCHRGRAKRITERRSRRARQPSPRSRPMCFAGRHLPRAPKEAYGPVERTIRISKWGAPPCECARASPALASSMRATFVSPMGSSTSIASEMPLAPCNARWKRFVREGT